MSWGKKHNLSENGRKSLIEKLSGSNNPNWGKPKSLESLAKQSRAMSGENNPNYGKHCSEETKKKISAALRGRIFNSKLTEFDVIKILELLSLNKSAIEIAKMFDINRATIYDIKSGKTWKNIERNKIKQSDIFYEPYR